MRNDGLARSRSRDPKRFAGCDVEPFQIQPVGQHDERHFHITSVFERLLAIGVGECPELSLGLDEELGCLRAGGYADINKASRRATTGGQLERQVPFCVITTSL